MRHQILKALAYSGISLGIWFGRWKPWAVLKFEAAFVLHVLVHPFVKQLAHHGQIQECYLPR
jgi:hypothetical protein